jgi:subtilisin family serine protease
MVFIVFFYKGGNMSRKNRPILILILIAGVVGLFSAGFFSGCSSPAKPTLRTLFDEGRTIFYKAVAEEVAHHPMRGQLNPAELTKIRKLQVAYPRLYAILVNYYYQKDAPVFKALLDSGSGEAMRCFREKYLDLARFSAHMFAESLFEPSPTGAYFMDLIPRFKGKDAVDLVAMSAGLLAKLDLPSPDKIEHKTLSPEFEKQWGLDAARFRAAHKLTKGRGVRVAVIDSGIDISHPVFQNTRWGAHFNFVGRDGFPWVENGPPMVDWGWHGTVVTSIVARYAPEAQITVYRYLDSDTQNDSPLPLVVTSLMGAAIYKAVHDGNDVINLSAGSNLHVPYLQEACRYARDHNVIFVTAGPYYMGRYLGGNEDYPGQYPENVSVTAIAKLGENRYGYWDVAAPESTITVGSPNAPFVAYPTYVGEKDDYAAGISCATPIVASLVALVESVYPRLGTEPPGQYADTIKKLLTENADPRAVGFDGFSPECGFGLIDAEKTVKAALRLADARRVQNPGPDETSPAPSPKGDAVFLEGEKVFYGQLKLTLGLHPERQRLLASEIDRIERGADGIPHLYENLVNILFMEAGRELMAFRTQNDMLAFRDRYLALCRDAADHFVESLFCESPGTQDLLAFRPNLGRGRLDLVLASLGRKSRPLPSPDVLKNIGSVALEHSPAFEIGKFRQAQNISTGKGLKVAIIDSGWAFGSESPENTKINHSLDFSLINRIQSPWSGEPANTGDGSGRGTLMALIASRCAPGAEIRTYRIGGDPDSPYEYWPALELAQAIYKAAQDGNDIILTGAAFGRDFPFLKEACQSAYLRNVLIFAPNGLLRSENAYETPAYPAAYNSVIAVAGAAFDKGNRPVPWVLSAASKSTAVTAPAFVGAGISPSNAYAVSACGGLAALISSRIPKTGKELPGQYVQRIAEIMKKSADSKILGFADFNLKTGYGLVDAEKAVGPAVLTYIKKMNDLEDNFKKRMAQRAKEAEEAAQKDAAEKETSARKK